MFPWTTPRLHEGARTATSFHERLDGIVLMTDAAPTYILRSLNGSLQLDTMKSNNRNDYDFFIVNWSWTVVGEETLYLGFSTSDQTIKVWQVIYESYFWEWRAVSIPKASPATGRVSNSNFFVATSIYIFLANIVSSYLNNVARMVYFLARIEWFLAIRSN